MNRVMWRKLADGEHPYDESPFGADHIKVFRQDAREILDRLAQLEALAQAVKVYVAPKTQRDHVAREAAYQGLCAALRDVDCES